MVAKYFALPEDVKPFEFQIAGHQNGLYGILKHRNGNILKPLPENETRIQKELDFYTQISGKASSSLHQELCKFLPEYKGHMHLNIEGKSIEFLCLEDISGTFCLPSILDVKIGARTWDSSATEEKIEYEISKSPYGESIGFRIVGMKVYDSDINSYIIKNKSFGKQLLPDTVLSGLQLFLSRNALQNCIILSGFIHQLVQIEDWFNQQREFVFYASSILLIYESSATVWMEWLQERGLTEVSVNIQDLSKCSVCPTCQMLKTACDTVHSYTPLYRASMIDFGHVEAAYGKDENYINGLRKLIEHIKTLLCSEMRRVSH